MDTFWNSRCQSLLLEAVRHGYLVHGNPVTPISLWILPEEVTDDRIQTQLCNRRLDMYDTEDGNQTSGRLLCVRLNYSMLIYQHARLHRIITRMHWPEGSATKEISYTSWRNQLNHEKSKQMSLKSCSEISPTLQPHPLLQL